MTDEFQVPDSASRCSNRVSNYAKYRPGYPDEVIDLLKAKFHLQPGARVADIGSGTGIFSRLLLDAEFSVACVEPNAKMRDESDRNLGSFENYRSLPGTAEATGLAGQSLDLVVVAQAFHWFDPDKTRLEFARILAPGGGVALIWNERDKDSAFARAYNSILRKSAQESGQGVKREIISDADIDRFFGRPVVATTLQNQHWLDFEGLQGRFLSSSYAPTPQQAHYAETIDALRELFDSHAHDGEVMFPLNTRVFAESLNARI